MMISRLSCFVHLHIHTCIYYKFSILPVIFRSKSLLLLLLSHLLRSCMFDLLDPFIQQNRISFKCSQYDSRLYRYDNEFPGVYDYATSSNRPLPFQSFLWQRRLVAQRRSNSIIDFLLARFARFHSYFSNKTFQSKLVPKKRDRKKRKKTKKKYSLICYLNICFI